MGFLPCCEYIDAFIVTPQGNERRDGRGIMRSEYKRPTPIRVPVRALGRACEGRA